MWQVTSYFGLYHKKVFDCNEKSGDWGMGFSFRSRSLFAVTAYVGSEFLSSLSLLFSVMLPTLLLRSFEVSFFNIDI